MNAFSPAGRTAIVDHTIDCVNDDLKIAAVSSAYEYQVEHTVFSDVTGVLGTPTSLSGKVWLPDAVFDCDDVAYPDVQVGQTVRGWWIYQDTGSPSTSLLIAWIDESTEGIHVNIDGTGTPIPVNFSDGPHRVFRL